MTTHNDEPCLIDELRLDKIVAQIAEELATCPPPHVFGLHGDWGSGKTSLLHQIQFKLSNDCPQQNIDQLSAERQQKLKLTKPVKNHKEIEVVWFESWRYQNEAAPVVALLHEMRQQLGWIQNLKSKANKAARVAIRGAALSMEDLTKHIGIQASKIEKAGVDWEREHLAVKLPSHTIREQLEAAIDGLVGNTKRTPKRVVVLIDDIDRCEPEAAYRLLEGLKIYLTLPNCVFLLGMNQRIVEDAIGKHVPTAKEDETLRRERAGAYLEKLCQNIWRVPFIQNPKDYLLGLLEDQVQRTWIDHALGNLNCLPPNPRRLKGLANLITRLIPRMTKNTGSSDDPVMILEAKHLLVVAQFHQFHHHLYRRWTHEPGFWDRICDWATDRQLSPLKEPAQRGSVEELFAAMQPVQQVFRNESTSVPEPLETTSAYPDPTESNVCWAQPLIIDLYNQDPQMSSDGFLRFLRPYHQ